MPKQQIVLTVTIDDETGDIETSLAADLVIARFDHGRMLAMAIRTVGDAINQNAAAMRAIDPADAQEFLAGIRYVAEGKRDPRDSDTIVLADLP